MKKLKVFKIETKGEETWVSAYTIIHALQTYCFMMDVDLYEFDIDEKIIEIPKNEWGNYTVNHGNNKTETIAKFMEKNDEATVIASTAFYEL